MDWDVMVHGSWERDGTGVVRKGPHHVEVARDRTEEVQPQVAQGYEGVAKETETLADLEESPLVVLPFLRRNKKTF